MMMMGDDVVCREGGTRQMWWVVSYVRTTFALPDRGLSNRSGEQSISC